jgi:hypothetical protein
VDRAHQLAGASLAGKESCPRTSTMSSAEVVVPALAVTVDISLSFDRRVH